jgi:hypothetical protein
MKINQFPWFSRKSMQIIPHYFFFLLLIFAGGCASKEAVYENIYEGLKSREEIVHPHPTDDPMPAETPTYNEYRRERDKALEEGKTF